MLGTGAAALALTAVTTGAAWATGTPGGDGWGTKTYTPGKGAGTVTEADRCQFSLDGANFYDSVKVDDQNLRPTDDGKVHIKVRTAGDATTCTASLASYQAHGPTFATSGEQVFIDFDTVTVKSGRTDSLDIAVPDAGCYAQIDLYRGAVKFDGKPDANDGFEHGELPKGPDRPVIKDKLIAAWNGGTKDCTTSENPPPAENPPPTSSAPTPTPSSPGEETPPESEEPGKPEEPRTETSTPPAEASTTPAQPTPNGSSTPTPDGDLAETGGGNTVPIAIGAAALLAAGGGIFVVSRRRAAGSRG
ncbi:LPXTG cell wall anchor domain-containing protein [Streptomyces sp. KM273126]|uniref:LAETG motif-containing sortase-dependent surface protein n=1 Tax=Streptomyces sp. KM273126 TaxID=2545247 RepID=UPI0015EC9F2E|nr:LAETG motif-containing sortase-dependent surface protein [Streptomyces sp. KM273126]MBA2807655.1 LPXTG cell wall anchor domain-containing protein [Streptomyces sp. KM273126]